MQHRIRFVLPAFALLTLLFTHQAAQASSIQLPQTGQTLCYDAAGGVIACTGTGQDGEKLAGKPSPAPRFTESNGTVTDNLTGLVWLKNAGCFETVGGITKGTDAAHSTLTWSAALTWSNSLKSGDCDLTDGSAAGDWRLPNVTELESLVDAQKANPALTTGHPFTSIQNVYYYWSSTTFVDAVFGTANANAWFVDMSDGYVSNISKGDSLYVWPVRDGQ